METTYGNLGQLLGSCFFSLNCRASEESGHYSIFTAYINGEECKRLWSGACKPRAVQGLELIAKGVIKANEISPENIVSIKRITYNHYSGCYTITSENLLNLGVYPIRID